MWLMTCYKMLKRFCVVNKKTTFYLPWWIDFNNRCHMVAFSRYVNCGEIKFFYDSKMLPQTKAKIYALFCLHIGKKRYVFEKVCWHLHWWYPISDFSIVLWGKKILMYSQHTCFFPEKCWYLIFLKLKWKKFCLKLQKMAKLTQEWLIHSRM